MSIYEYVNMISKQQYEKMEKKTHHILQKERPINIRKVREECLVALVSSPWRSVRFPLGRSRDASMLRSSSGCHEFLCWYADWDAKVD